MPQRTLTCVYCAHEYPQDSPAHSSSVLTDHIKTCPSHPLRKAEADVALLRSALIGLLQAEDETELRAMERVIRTLPIPDLDRAASINAIHAVLATAPCN